MDKGGAQPLPIFCETVMKYILIITLSLSFLSIEAQAGSPEIGDGCNIAIGNVIDSGKGASTSARRETTVVITGDVVQAGNRCR